MDFNLILYILVFVIVIFLIFKLIKKVFLAIIATIVFVILIIGGIGALVYIDYKDLSNVDKFDVGVLYSNSHDNLEFGFRFEKGEDESIGIENIKKIDVDEINLDELKKSKEIYLLFKEDFFENVLVENKSYYLPNTEDLKIMTKEINTELTRDEVIEIFNSDNSEDEYIDIIFDKNEFVFENDLVKKLIKTQIELQLGNLELREVLFVSVFDNLEIKNSVDIIDGIKDDTIEVFPTKFSIKVIKYIPTSFIRKFIK